MQSALGLKAPSASPTFTGTTTGITKAVIELGNADNTADVDKPISTATQTALDGKFNKTNTYTEGDVDLTISNLIASAPEALNTLNELAQALVFFYQLALKVGKPSTYTNTAVDNAPRWKSAVNYHNNKPQFSKHHSKQTYNKNMETAYRFYGYSDLGRSG